jgi:TonB-dependent receptor
VNKTNSALKKYGDSSPFYVKMRTSASVLALLAVGALPVYAQDDEMVEEVVVTGMKASIKSAQDIKQNANQVVDSITAVDIGALPDRSVSEALQRIPGVQLQRTNEARDPARLAAEGGDVFVRGLSWVRTELNGRDIFSANNGRSLGFEDVSADLLAGIDVYKNPTADQVEGGLGGTVNLRTRLPFDSDDRVFAGTVDYNDADMLGEGFTSTNVIASDRWDVGGGEVGFLFSVSLAEIGNRTDAIQTGRYEGYEVGSDTQYLPTGLGFRRVDWHQDRNSFYGAMQWAPNEKLTVTATGLRAEATPIDVERAVGVGFADPDQPGASWDLTPTTGEYTYNNDNEVVSGTLSGAYVTNNMRYGKRESVTSDYSVGFEYAVSDNFEISGDFQNVSSETSVLSMTVFTAPMGSRETIFVDTDDVEPNESYYHGTDFPSVDFRLTGDPMLSIHNQELLSDQSEYFWGAAMDHIESNKADSTAARLDAEFMFEDNSLLKSVKFGARATNKEAITRQSGYNWNILSDQFWFNWGKANTQYLDEYEPERSEVYTYDDFMRGDVSVPSVGWFAKEDVVNSNTKANAILAGTVTNGWGWSPLLPPSAYDFDPQADNVSAGINRQEEQTSAIYGSLNFGNDELMGIPFDGNLGVRVVKTETTAWGRSVSGNAPAECEAAPSEDCAAANAFATAYNAELSDYKSFSNSYTNVLPSLNVRFLLTDDLQLRTGLSKGMVRPSFSQTRPYSSLGFEFTGTDFTHEDYQGTGFGGAPGLEPTVANQFDLSLEWFFADAGSLSGAFFYKDISDYVSLRTGLETISVGGESMVFEASRQSNADDGKLKGFELAYSQFFDFLPSPMDGLGVQANFTYIDNEGGANTAVNPFDGDQVENAGNQELPIEGISDTSYNLAVMYEKYDVAARLAYNWREKYLLTASAANLNVPTWMNDYGQLDGSLFYTVNDHLKLGVQATNILQARTTMDVGYPDQVAAYSWTDSDRRVAFVVRWNF